MSDITAKELVEMLPKDGSPVRFGNFIVQYVGEYKYADEDDDRG